MKTLGEAQEMIAALKTDLEYAENERRKLAEALELYRDAYETEDALHNINSALITRVEKAEQERDQARAELETLR